MADFLLAIRPVLSIEGYSQNKRTGYVNDKDDAGGETIGGIARNFWPNELVWKYVDIAKKDKVNFPKNLGAIPGLDDSVLSFYLRNFWNKIGGNGIKTQPIAGVLVNAAVNLGIPPAIKMAEGLVHVKQVGVVDPELISKLNAL